MSDLSDKEVALLKEVLSDAETSSLLSQWEEDFLEDLRARFRAYGNRLMVSDKQWQVIQRIEAKLYQ